MKITSAVFALVAFLVVAHARGLETFNNPSARDRLDQDRIECVGELSADRSRIVFRCPTGSWKRSVNNISASKRDYASMLGCSKQMRTDYEGKDYFTVICDRPPYGKRSAPNPAGHPSAWNDNVNAGTAS
ncbi:unnamed protein product [Candidula unifasciata]|uniref:Secreted protein n=1 Tax=Candidula unifasciata TaxID=100452 RepID=A0A8S3ZC83_9EUPU|nr:unnamed protein product [Candidula unifasciata]